MCALLLQMRFTLFGDSQTPSIVADEWLLAPVSVSSYRDLSLLLMNGFLLQSLFRSYRDLSLLLMNGAFHQILMCLIKNYTGPLSQETELCLFSLCFNTEPLLCYFFSSTLALGFS